MHMYKKCMELYTVYTELDFARFIIQYSFIEFKSSAPHPHTIQYKCLRSPQHDITHCIIHSYIHFTQCPCTFLWNTYPSLRMYEKLMIPITDGDRRTDHFWGTLSYMCLQQFLFTLRMEYKTVFILGPCPSTYVNSLVMLSLYQYYTGNC